MPYIKPEARVRFQEGLNALPAPSNTGELNYVVSMIASKYLYEHKLSYATCSEITAALDNAKDEFLRRFVAPYEDEKIVENGDVYQNVPKT